MNDDDDDCDENSSVYLTVQVN